MIRYLGELEFFDNLSHHTALLRDELNQISRTFLSLTCNERIRLLREHSRHRLRSAKITVDFRIANHTTFVAKHEIHMKWNVVAGLIGEQIECELFGLRCQPPANDDNMPELESWVKSCRKFHHFFSSFCTSSRQKSYWCAREGVACVVFKLKFDKEILSINICEKKSDESESFTRFTEAIRAQGVGVRLTMRPEFDFQIFQNNTDNIVAWLRKFPFNEQVFSTLPDSSTAAAAKANENLME